MASAKHVEDLVRGVEAEPLKATSSLRIRRLAGLKRAGDSNALFLLDLKGDFVGRLGLESRNRSKGRSLSGPGRRMSIVGLEGFVSMVGGQRSSWLRVGNDGEKSYNAVNKRSRTAALPFPTVTRT